MELIKSFCHRERRHYHAPCMPTLHNGPKLSHHNCPFPGVCRSLSMVLNWPRPTAVHCKSASRSSPAVYAQLTGKGKGKCIAVCDRQTRRTDIPVASQHEQKVVIKMAASRPSRSTKQPSRSFRPTRSTTGSTHLPFDAFNERDPVELSGSYWYGKTGISGLQSSEGRMMIDSVVWAQYINVTDTQTATSP